MVYFELRMGIDCGIHKNSCPGYPDRCTECLREQLENKGFSVEDVSLSEKDTKERQLDTLQANIWQKYSDLLNIKHVMILDKNSGSCILNIPVSDQHIDGTLFAGFITANVLFSAKSMSSAGNGSGNENENAAAATKSPAMAASKAVVSKAPTGARDSQFYEFSYQDFHVILNNGYFTRVCLILDMKPSDNLKFTLSKFLKRLEEDFKNSLFKFTHTGKLGDLNRVPALAREMFELQLLDPMTMPEIIEPKVVKNFSTLEKGIYETARDTITEKGFCFATDLVSQIQQLSHKEPKEIIWQIYKFIKMGIFVPRDLEELGAMIDAEEVKGKGKRDFQKAISLFRIPVDEILTIKDECKQYSEKEAKDKIEGYLRNGAFLEKQSLFQQARESYEKGLIVAQVFNFEKYKKKITETIRELVQKNRQIELDHALDVAKGAEKKKDYITAIKYYLNAQEILEDLYDVGRDDKRVQKIRRKIKNLQEAI